MSITILGAFSLIVSSLIYPATLWSSPGVTSMTKRSDILMVFLTDWIGYGIVPNLLGSVGYAVVLLCSVGMAFSDGIEACICKKTPQNEEQIENERRDSIYSFDQ